MAYNDRKILDVLRSKVADAPERCSGYREELGQLLGDVLNLERDHAIARINIVMQIRNQVNTVGMFLHRCRSDDNQSFGDAP